MANSSCHQLWEIKKKSIKYKYDDFSINLTSIPGSGAQAHINTFFVTELMHSWGCALREVMCLKGGSFIF